MNRDNLNRDAPYEPSSEFRQREVLNEPWLRTHNLNAIVAVRITSCLGNLPALESRNFFVLLWQKREIPFKACSYLHPPLSHRNARNVAPRWDGNLSGSRAVRVGISRMDELVYIVPRVNRSRACVCVLCTYFCYRTLGTSCLILWYSSHQTQVHFFI